jgi:hypothetical protein
MKEFQSIEDFNSKIKRVIITKEEIDAAIKKAGEEIDLDASLDDDDTPMPDRDLVATMEEGDVPISFEDDIEDEMSIEDIDDDYSYMDDEEDDDNDGLLSPDDF